MNSFPPIPTIIARFHFMPRAFIFGCVFVYKFLQCNKVNFILIRINYIRISIT